MQQNLENASEESVNLIAKAQTVKTYIVNNIVNNDIVNDENKEIANIAVKYLENLTCKDTQCLDDDPLDTLQSELKNAFILELNLELTGEETEEGLKNKKNDAINNAIKDAFEGFCPISDELKNQVEPQLEQQLEGGARSESDFSMMGGDPLFLVLSEFFVSKSGKNIADIMEELNENLQGKKGKWPFGKK